MTLQVLAVEGLTKSFGSTKVVDAVSFTVGRGELMTFLGPSGCGKTTLLRLIGGFLDADAGTIMLDGHRVNDVPPEQRATAMVFQSYALFPHMTVVDNVAYGLKVRRLPRAAIERKVDELLEVVKLAEFAQRKPHELSGGQQQRVAIARALSVQPKVLLLDEPLSNLDAHLRIAMRGEIRRLQRELHLTICLVTHDQEEALSMSDRIAVLRQGRVEQIGCPTDVYFQPRTQFVAQFIGQVNLIRARVSALDAAAGTASLRLADHTDSELIAYGVPERLAVGDSVHAVLRPDALAVLTAPGTDGIVAQVREVAFLGAIIRYHLASPVGQIMVDAPTSSGVPATGPGDDVVVTLPRECHVLR